MELTELKPKEERRVYHWHNKDRSPTVFSNVTHFISSMTTHRLKLEDGRLIIIPVQDLNYIEITAESFTI